MTSERSINILRNQEIVFEREFLREVMMHVRDDIPFNTIKSFHWAVRRSIIKPCDLLSLFKWGNLFFDWDLIGGTS